MNYTVTTSIDSTAATPVIADVLHLVYEAMKRHKNGPARIVLGRQTESRIRKYMMANMEDSHGVDANEMLGMIHGVPVLVDGLCPERLSVEVVLGSGDMSTDLPCTEIRVYTGPVEMHPGSLVL